MNGPIVLKDPMGGRLVALAFGAALSTSSCLVDDNVCGDQLRQDDEGACVCPEGSVIADGQCQKCGRHEEARNNSCVCEEGYSRADSGDCEPDKNEDEETTDSSAECEHAGCMQASTDAGPGVVPECGSSEECADDEVCDVHGSGACIPLPEGFGEVCSSADDCAGSEAAYCELFSTHTCQIGGCKDRGGICPGDMACCDFAILSTSLCVPAANLEGGQCPAPGQLVEREEAQ